MAFDMIYRLDITEKRNGKNNKYVKYGVTNQHAEDRARRVTESARKNGHDLYAKASKYDFNPSKSQNISRVEKAIHSNKKYAHYDDGGCPFNGSTEIYQKREARSIEKQLRKEGIRFKKCK